MHAIDTSNGPGREPVQTEEQRRIAELRERAAAIQAKREAVEAAREAAHEERKLNEKIAREERALADAEALARLEAELGPEGEKIRAVQTPAGMVILKRATNAAFRRFMDAKEASVDVAEKLVRPCVIHPGRVEFDQIVEEYPALWTPLAGALTKLAGHRTQEVAEK